MTEPVPTSAAALSSRPNPQASLWMPHRYLFLLFGVLLSLGLSSGTLLGGWRAHVFCSRSDDECVLRMLGGSEYRWRLAQVGPLSVEDRGDDGYALVLQGGGQGYFVADAPARAILDEAVAKLAAFRADPASSSVHVSVGNRTETGVAIGGGLLGLLLLALGFRRTVFEVDPVAGVLTIEKRRWPLVPPTIVHRGPVEDVVSLRFSSNIDGASKLAVVLRGGGALQIHTGLDRSDAARVAAVLGKDVADPAT